MGLPPSQCDLEGNVGEVLHFAGVQQLAMSVERPSNLALMHVVYTTVTSAKPPRAGTTAVGVKWEKERLDWLKLLVG